MELRVAELQRFGNVVGFDRVAASKVGNSSCHLANPVVATRAQRELLDGCTQQPQPRTIQPTVAREQRRGEPRVRPDGCGAVSPLLALARIDDAGANRSR